MIWEYLPYRETLHPPINNPRIKLKIYLKHIHFEMKS